MRPPFIRSVRIISQANLLSKRDRLLDINVKNHGQIHTAMLMNPCTLADCCQKTSDTALLAKLFRGLGDPTRLAILEALRERERRVVDLVEVTGRSQPNVSAHLACLRDCGLIVGKPAGRETFYALASERLEDVLVAAQDVLTLTGNQVCGCGHYQENT